MKKDVKRELRELVQFVEFVPEIVKHFGMLSLRLPFHDFENFCMAIWPSPTLVYVNVRIPDVMLS